MGLIEDAQALLILFYNYVNSIVQAIGNYVSTLVTQLVTWVGSIVTTIGNALTTIVTSLSNFLVTIYQQIKDTLTAVITQISSALASVINQIRQTLTDIVNALFASIQNILSSFYSAVVDTVNNIRSYIGGLIDQVVSLVVDGINNVRTFVQTAVSYIQSLIQSAINYIGNVASAIVSAVVQGLNILVQVFAGFVNTVQSAIVSLIQTLINDTTSIANGLINKLQDISTSFEDAAVKLVESIGNVGEQFTDAIKSGVKTFADAFVPTGDPVKRAALVKALEGIHTDPTSMASFRAWWQDGWRQLEGSSAAYQTVFVAIMSFMALVPSMWAIGNYLAQEAVQEFAAQYPNQPLSPADAVNFWRHDLIEAAEAVENIKRAGFPQANADKLIRASGNVPSIQELIAMKLRGIVSADNFNHAMKVNGIDPPWTDFYAELAKLIPPASDLITMAVHDVWDPAAVELGRVFEDIPPEFIDWTAKQGLTEYWAKNYWGAHWSLPSPQQGFEMYHRGVIDETQLKVLLKALDVAPGWRDKLMAINFHTLTRVDIRRMHKMGVLTDGEVNRAHLDLGYSAENAQRLTEFVLKLNRTVSTAEGEDLGQLSRTAILGFYRDGLIDRPGASKLLVDLGSTLTSAQLWLASVDFEEERKDRAAETGLIIDQAVAGSITFEQAQNQLAQLGLETVEMQKAVTQLLRAQQKRVKLPSQDDGEKFFVAGIISQDDYADLLSRLGFAPKWVAAYVTQGVEKRNAAKESGRNRARAAGNGAGSEPA